MAKMPSFHEKIDTIARRLYRKRGLLVTNDDKRRIAATRFNVDMLANRAMWRRCGGELRVRRVWRGTHYQASYLAP